MENRAIRALGELKGIANIIPNQAILINAIVLQEARLTKMAVLHYQFESIHPFYDGNGRTSRIVNMRYLILKG